MDAATKVACLLRNDFTLRSSSSKRLARHLSTRYGAGGDRVSVGNNERERERERGREHGGCVLRQGMSVFQLSSGWFPARTSRLIPLSLPLSPYTRRHLWTNPKPSMSHLRTGLILNALRVAPLLPGCSVSSPPFCGTSPVPLLRFHFKVPLCQFTAFTVLLGLKWPLDVSVGRL